MPADPQASTLGPSRLGPYQVVGRLTPAGAAATVKGEVYLVRRSGTEALFVAHHLVAPAIDPAAELQRFRQLGSEHAAIPKLVDIVREGDKLGLVFEQVEGVTLGRLISHLEPDREPLPEPAVWFIAEQVMGALARCHTLRDAGGRLAPLVHGRLSAHSVLVTWRGDVRVMGLCPLLDGMEYPSEEQAPPTPSWLAPELRRGWPASPRADVYAAALLVRCMLTSNPPPASGAPIEPLSAMRPDLSAELTSALDRALEPSARDRATSCAELERRMAPLVSDSGGRESLLGAMEMFQALWSLWSVSPARSGPPAPGQSESPSADTSTEVSTDETTMQIPLAKLTGAATSKGIPRPGRQDSTPEIEIKGASISEAPVDFDSESTVIMAVPEVDDDDGGHTVAMAAVAPESPAEMAQMSTVALDVSPLMDVSRAALAPSEGGGGGGGHHALGGRLESRRSRGCRGERRAQIPTAGIA